MLFAQHLPFQQCHEAVCDELVILKSLSSIPLRKNAFGRSILLPVGLVEQKPKHVQNQFSRCDCKDYQATTQTEECLIGPATCIALRCAIKHCTSFCSHRGCDTSSCAVVICVVFQPIYVAHVKLGILQLLDLLFLVHNGALIK